MIVTRFAPSPTGYLHLGHAYSALFAFEAARREGGKFLLRIEDIDPVRCKPEFTQAIFEDLAWLGLSWEQPVLRQSEHLADYAAALEQLKSRGVVYPCFCTRREILAEIAASGHAPHSFTNSEGADGAVYPGTCRNVPEEERARRLAEGAANWRLDISKAMEMTGALFWRDRAAGRVEAQPQDFGDVVIARKDVATSYHLSVTVDDHRQGITLVTRGDDLRRATDIHRLLQALLNFHVPDYHHHKLLKNDEGKRFAKRDNAVTLRSLRQSGKRAEDVITKVRQG